MCRDLGHQRREVPERVVRGGGLRHREVRLRLRGVDQVRELHRVLDEEDRDVVADQVPVAFVGVELHREAADVARGVGRAALAEHRREADEDRRLLAGLGEDRRARVLASSGSIALEVAVRRRAAGVHDALGDPLVIEVGDLLAKDEVLEQRRPAQARPSASSGCRRPARPGWWSGSGRSSRRARGRAEPPSGSPPGWARRCPTLALLLDSVTVLAPTMGSGGTACAPSSGPRSANVPYLVRLGGVVGHAGGDRLRAGHLHVQHVGQRIRAAPCRSARGGFRFCRRGLAGRFLFAHKPLVVDVSGSGGPRLSAVRPIALAPEPWKVRSVRLESQPRRKAEDRAPCSRIGGPLVHDVFRHHG